MVHPVLSNICHDLGWKLIWLTIKILSVFPLFHLWPLTIFSFLCNDARMVVWSILKSDKAWSLLSEDYIILQNIKVNFYLKNALLGLNYKIVFVPSRDAKKLHVLLRHVSVRIICVNGKIKCVYERVWVCISIKCMLCISA